VTTIELLEAAKAKIDTPENWCKGDYAKTKKGNPIHSLAEQACQWCSLGALVAVTSSSSQTVSLRCKAIDLLFDVVGRDVVAFNDDPKTTHADVLAAFDRAIELAKLEAVS
jgi:hypothetical protein